MLASDASPLCPPDQSRSATERIGTYAFGYYDAQFAPSPKPPMTTKITG
jgi:hypothetical protein